MWSVKAPRQRTMFPDKEPLNLIGIFYGITGFRMKAFFSACVYPWNLIGYKHLTIKLNILKIERGCCFYIFLLVVFNPAIPPASVLPRVPEQRPSLLHNAFTWVTRGGALGPIKKKKRFKIQPTKNILPWVARPLILCCPGMVSL